MLDNYFAGTPIGSIQHDPHDVMLYGNTSSWERGFNMLFHLGDGGSTVMAAETASVVHKDDVVLDGMLQPGVQPIRSSRRQARRVPGESAWRGSLESFSGCRLRGYGYGASGKISLLRV